MNNASGASQGHGRAAGAVRAYSLMRGGLVYALIGRSFGDRSRRLHVWLAVVLASIALLPIVAATFACQSGATPPKYGSLQISK